MKIHGHSYDKIDTGAERAATVTRMGTGAFESRVDKLTDGLETEIQKIKESEHLEPGEKKKWLGKLYEKKEDLAQSAAIDGFNAGLETLHNAKKAREKAELYAGVGDSESTTTDGSERPDKLQKKPKAAVDSEGLQLQDSGTTDDSGEVDKALEEFDVEEMADKMMEDPQAAFDEINKMKFEDAQMAFNQLQMYMQQIQRMTKMMSNLTSMAHKTESAVIGNIR